MSFSDAVPGVSSFQGAVEARGPLAGRSAPRLDDFFTLVTTGLPLNCRSDHFVFPDKPIERGSPLVTWAVVSSLNNHNWLNRVAEYLQDDPHDMLPGSTELILLFTQNHLTRTEAYRRIGEWIASQKSFKCNRRLEEKAASIRVIQDLRLRKRFNISWARLRLVQEARGDFLFFRDADTRLTGANVTNLALRSILRSNVAVLGFPSARNHKPFKPYAWEAQTKLPDLFPGITLVNTVAGMATFSLTNLERRYLKNPALVGFGEFFASCAKIASSGYALGYVDSQVPLLSTDESEISVPHLSGGSGYIPFEKFVCLRLIADYYDRNRVGAPLRREFEEKYLIDLTNVSADVEIEVARRSETFSRFQRAPQEASSFQPSLSALYGSRDPFYFDRAYWRGLALHTPVVKKLEATQVGRRWLAG